MAAPYAELHTHSCFSLLDGACQPDALVERAAALGYAALALTDHDALYGVLRFERACRERGLHAVVGAEVTLDDDSHVTLLAEDDQGYATLSRLLSKARLGREKGTAQLPFARLEAEHAGLILLTGCRRGPLARRLDARRPLAALDLARRLADVFAGRCYVELQRHGLAGDDRRRAELAALAEAVGLPVVATGDVHYLDDDTWRLQDLLVCIREGVTVDEAHPARGTSAEYALRPPEQMAERFARYHEAVANSLRLAARCRVSLDFRAVRFPPLPLPPGETADARLRRVAEAGAARRYGSLSEPIRRQLDHELGVIARLGVADFFLICADLARRFRGRGRGSAADSLVAYCVGITQVDPIRHKLLFERFLNEARPSMPDIDIDFGVEDREAAIQYVYDRYGRERAAMVCNYVTFQPRLAVRDAGKALGLSPEVVDVLAKAVGRHELDRLAVEARRLAPTLPETEQERLASLARIAPRLLDLPRHLSIHAGGMLIAGAPLVEVAPLEPARMLGRTVIGWDKEDVEAAGLIKTDLLCIRALSLIHEAADLIERQTGCRPDLAALRLDNPAVYRQLREADTIGTFQVESRAQGQSLPRTRPSCFADLVAQVAIIRPGPIEGGMVHTFVRRRQGLEPVRYLHPSLEPILRETYGVILYQEQVLQVAVAVAGFSAGEADGFRRAMGTKRSRAGMEALRERFLAGACSCGVAESAARQIFEQMASFAAYGFCKSHAAALAKTAYETLWLRTHHRAPFYASLLNNQPMGFYSPEVILWDAVRHGVRFSPPDVTRSGARCTLEGATIRLGLGYVKHVGETGAARIVAAREERPFASAEDAATRAALTPEQFRSLALVGAFDAFGAGRRQLLWRLLALPRGRPGQPALPAEIPEPEVTLPVIAEAEQTYLDYAILGLCVDRQVMALYRRQRQLLHVTPSHRLGQRRDGERVRVAGLVVCRQAPQTAKGVLFLSLEDEWGLVNVIVRPATGERYREQVRRAPMLLIDGRVERDACVVSVLAEEVRAFAPSATETASKSGGAGRAELHALAHNFR